MGLIEQIAERQERIEAKLDQLLARGPADEPTCDRHEAAHLVRSTYGTVSQAEKKHLIPPPIDGRSTYVRTHVLWWATLPLERRKVLHDQLTSGQANIEELIAQSGALRLAK
jgi:hypothetical protein